MFRFASPQMFYLLLLVPVVVGLYLLGLKARARRLARFGNPSTLASLMPDVSYRRVRNKFVIALCAMVLIIVALARPQVGAKFKEVTKTGVEIMLAVDVSNSMLAQDLEPNRLERTKYAIIQMLSSLKQDQVGMIVFAGNAYVQLPVTSDYVAARNFVSSVSTDMLSEQGTDIGAAIDLALLSFSSQSEGSRVIILVTDGEDHGEDALAAARRAEEAGVKIYVIGVGTPEGAPLYVDGDYIKDENGNMVVSRLDEEGLRNIALSTGGGYIRAENGNMGLQNILDDIRETETSTFKAQVFEEYDEQYQYPLAIALVLLLVDMLVISRRNRLLAKFDIFKKG